MIKIRKSVLFNLCCQIVTCSAYAFKNRLEYSRRTCAYFINYYRIKDS